jgi:flagellar biosynthesis/type III secretory pathway M-ring protein FliF/YscJ
MNSPSSRKKIWQAQAPAQTAKNKPSREELELVLKRTQELVQKNPEKAAIILSTWLNPKKTTKAA